MEPSFPPQPQFNLNWKIFVKEQGDNYVEQAKQKYKVSPTVPLTGDKAKELYEEIINEPPQRKTRKIPVKKPTRVKPKTIPNFKQSDIFNFSQNNDINNLRLILSQPNIDINATDDYGWTALMCAACSGAKDSVALLLEKNANVSVCDKSYKTAISLARKNNHNEIVTIIKNYKKLTAEQKPKKQYDPIFCEVCKQEFKTDPEKHECSTLHLFNSKPKKLKTYYGIPDSNKGFQLLLKEGWDRELGLGPEGSGRKFPVKAIKKPDRSGIGAPPRPKEINHTAKYENKQDLLSKNHRTRSFERRFRLEFL